MDEHQFIIYWVGGLAYSANKIRSTGHWLISVKDEDCRILQYFYLYVSLYTIKLLGFPIFAFTLVFLVWMLY